MMTYHSNKKIGSEWEKECCRILRNNGYWVHFITPDSRGAQPFDIIAVKNGKAKAIDCKTCESNIFPFSRLEQNQIYAFERWIKCGNIAPEIWVKHNKKLYIICYRELKEKRRIRLQ